MTVIPTYHQPDRSLTTRQGSIHSYPCRKSVAEQVLKIAVRRPGALDSVVFLILGQAVLIRKLASDFRKDAFDFKVDTTSFGCAGD